MVIRSADRRLAVRLWIVSIFVDVAVAGVISYFLSPADDFWINTLWIWLGLQVAALLLMLLSTLHLFVAKWVGAFRSARDGFLTALESQEVPTPKHVVYSVDDYLADVADGEDHETKARIGAALLLGVRQGLKQCSGIVRWMMIDSAHEDALKEYASRHR